MMKLKKQIQQFVLDFETLDVGENAVVQRIACTPFTFDDKDVTYEQLLNRSFYIALDIKDQRENYGRTVGQGTIDFWKKQTTELLIESMRPTNNDLTLVEALTEFKKFLKDWNYDKFNSFMWCRGINFESPKMETMDKQAFPNEKWLMLNPRQYHDCRTFNWLMTGGETDKYQPEDFNELGFIEHVANHDSSMDAYRMIKLMNQ